ncbi:MAG TPA: hypothetical protein VGM90_38810 [Kofleriaceae bacterium]|jgi:hypothetical protein
MLLRAFLAIVAVASLGCPGGDGAIGASCGGNGDCDSSLQCVAKTCVPRCQRAPECGDGYACTGDGLCVAARGQNGDTCHSEVDCSAGLSCQIDGSSLDSNSLLTASCTKENAGRPTATECTSDAECRNGSCALGRCVDLCSDTRDCAAGNACTQVPRIEANGSMFEGCLPSRGNVVWQIPIAGPQTGILLPVPAAARSATIVFRVDDVAQKVGAEKVLAPHDDPSDPSYVVPCQPSGPNDPICNDALAQDRYFTQRIRHLPDFGQSVLQIPGTTAGALQPGAYKISVKSFRANGSVGSAIPHVTAVMKMDTAANLDLHFHFLDLDEHPCAALFGNEHLGADRAQTASFFQTQYLTELRSIIASANLSIGDITYDDIAGHHDLDTLAVDNAAALFSLGTHAQGVDIYFVRALSPVGIQAYGPNPGPAGVAGTRQSGIAIGMDTLCYQTAGQEWKKLARLTAHEIARYMGLYHNVELEADDGQYDTWHDGIDDDDSDTPENNLMFFSDRGGEELSAGQREILSRSPVLR